LQVFLLVKIQFVCDYYPNTLQQAREFTFIKDVVQANTLAATNNITVSINAGAVKIASIA